MTLTYHFAFGQPPKWGGLLTLFVALVPAASGAQDVPRPGNAGQQYVAIDSTLDFSSLGSRSFDVNGLFPLGGNINESGFRFRLTGSASWYRFVANENPRALASGQGQEGDFLVGYGFLAHRLSVLAAAGVAVTGSLDDLGISRSRFGAKAVLSAYSTPTDQTMIFVRTTYSSIGSAYELQMKGGVKVLGFGYLGPEIKFSGRENNDEHRFGPHLSGITVGPVSISLSGGWSSDRQLGSGHYFSTSLYAAF